MVPATPFSLLSLPTYAFYLFYFYYLLSTYVGPRSLESVFFSSDEKNTDSDHIIHSAQKYFHAHCYVAPYPRTYGLFILFAIYLYIYYISIYLIYEPFYVQIICPVHRYYTVYRRIPIMAWMITDPKLLA